MADHNNLGRWGEEIAVDHLVAQGYAIVERNVRLGKNEIDIVAMHGSRMVFVEVKTRSAGSTDPFDSLDAHKCARLCRAAEAYLGNLGVPHEAQIDIVVIIGEPHSYTVEHYPDSVRPNLR